MNKLLLTTYCILLTGFFFLLHSCDSSRANPYKEMYEQQVVVNDSLQAKITLLDQRLDLIYNASVQKIDSLKNAVAQKNIQIAQKDSIINMLNQLPQIIEDDLEHLSDKALQNLINIQKR